jgi:hypothetical protein
MRDFESGGQPTEKISKKNKTVLDKLKFIC